MAVPAWLTTCELGMSGWVKLARSFTPNSVGESAKDYFFFDKNGGLDLQMVADNELKILSNLPPTHPI